ncbi:PREDICTED: GTP-binding protein 10-like isoform X2 [Priapulus caudatus]|uniref:GTP-binding protein 10-like isoform X1 n=1 Tax=Priapulus caudatus TaxID=37621 RepID=A0ABM1EQX1_PRICU|nr:PREDICTED: GTP-binding protein 10-like isoform X1 [Priapulus caudatus]XP_014674599.1 PREDICTED: GTP-binding protein 10-like isoform X2 [Priapulus caudatus]
MVLIGRTLTAASKTGSHVGGGKFAKIRSKFVDTLRIYVRGGPGGMGLPRQSGVGGKGGAVYVQATHQITSLKAVKDAFPEKRFVGGAGGNSKSRKILGERGKDVLIPVPLGVTVMTDNCLMIGEVLEDKDKLLVVPGGEGGAPQNGWNGLKGKAINLTLDLKVIADIGLVGFPNAGKSTLLKAISGAKPKIANYPFTTMRPEIGTIKYEDFRQITVADLPGLIEGAHINIGLGYKFLKHVERTKLLLLVVDINGFQLSQKNYHRSAIETVLLLNKEMELYKEDLLYKPVVVAINKMDTPGAKDKVSELTEQLHTLDEVVKQLPEDIRPKRLLRFDHVVPISADKAHGVEKLKQVLRSVMDLYDDEFIQEVNQENRIGLKSRKEKGIQLV